MASGEELELAKAGIEQLGETGREMIRLVSGSSAASEVGGLLADQFRFQRFKRQLKLIKKAEKLIDEAGLSPQAIPLKILAPLIAWGSLEDDEEMISRWANLLASAGSTATLGFHVVYPELLRQLEPCEARMIEDLFVMEKDGEPVDRQVFRLKSGAWRTLERLLNSMHMSSSEIDARTEIDARNLQNLARLAVCEVRNDELFMLTATHSVSERPERTGGPEIRLTTLGLEFALVCQPPGKLR